ncbi:protein OSB2, chloroplastic isoform X2 [Jatropha curcas]|uniref:protein OSB2, chloroplastic isoform X2 n=1 Tax=Jatropha curcas TaxID=180498 RepID=UPI0005FC2968|nr:protein OSB2, chloroplastic isoform X2 [Jatropha curcas]
MAVVRTLLCSSRNIFIPVPWNPISNNLNPFLSLSHVRRADFKRLRVNRSLKCSLNYGDNQYNQVVEYVKPAAIPWNKELCNTVQLIGTVGTTVEIKHLPSGKVLAWTRLGFKKSATETSWINLTFWDELAQVAFEHVEKGHQIYVSGRLISDVVENDDGKQQTYYKVVVQQLNFVERSSVSAALYDRDSNGMVASRKLGNNAGNSTGSIEELWQAFFANPLEWWDNRKNKRNPKYPDFKHKDTGEALWVEGRNNPRWVKSQLAILDERMGSLREQDGRMNLNSFAGEDFMPMQ